MISFRGARSGFGNSAWTWKTYIHTYIHTYNCLTGQFAQHDLGNDVDAPVAPVLQGHVQKLLLGVGLVVAQFAATEPDAIAPQNHAVALELLIMPNRDIPVGGIWLLLGEEALAELVGSHLAVGVHVVLAEFFRQSHQRVHLQQGPAVCQESRDPF
jgi:hypothetical protein